MDNGDEDVIVESEASERFEALGVFYGDADGLVSERSARVCGVNCGTLSFELEGWFGEWSELGSSGVVQGNVAFVLVSKVELHGRVLG